MKWTIRVSAAVLFFAASVLALAVYNTAHSDAVFNGVPLDFSAGAVYVIPGDTRIPLRVDVGESFACAQGQRCIAGHFTAGSNAMVNIPLATQGTDVVDVRTADIVPGPYVERVDDTRMCHANIVIEGENSVVSGRCASLSLCVLKSARVDVTHQADGTCAVVVNARKRT